MKILVGCEESQAVTKELRALGHNAYSCDILPCSGGHPEWHIQQNLLYVIELGGWDMLIAFPPCTYLTKAGAHLWHERNKEQERAKRFVQLLWASKIRHIAIENPPGYLNTGWQKPTQIIQPWQYGHEYTKDTCLWLKNLPLLKPTNIMRERVSWTDSKRNPSTRSKTFPGIAKAMATQWTKNIIPHQLNINYEHLQI